MNILTLGLGEEVKAPIPAATLTDIRPAITLVQTLDLAVNLIEAAIVHRPKAALAQNLGQFIDTSYYPLLRELSSNAVTKINQVIAIEGLGAEAYDELETVTFRLGSDPRKSSQDDTPLGQQWKIWKASITKLENQFDHSTISASASELEILKEWRWRSKFFLHLAT